MFLRKIKESTEVRVLEIGDILAYFSKEELVAYSGPDGRFRTSSQFSPSTNSHLAIVGAISWKKVDQEQLENLLKNAIADGSAKKAKNEDVIQVSFANHQPKIERFSIKI